MGLYWGKVARIAAKQAAELLGFGSAERAVITVALQATVALLIYLMLGATELHVTTRLITSAAPLAVYPLLFVWKMFAVPAQLHKSQETEEERSRNWVVTNLSMIYINQTTGLPPETLQAIHYGLAYPPDDWVNERLAQHGYDWRVTSRPGAKLEYRDA